MRLHDIADIQDAKVAVQIVDACLREVAYDAKSGKYDIDRVISMYPGGRGKTSVWFRMR
jgi:replicative DNA helicase Mcm